MNNVLAAVLVTVTMVALAVLIGLSVAIYNRQTSCPTPARDETNFRVTTLSAPRKLLADGSLVEDGLLVAAANNSHGKPLEHYWHTTRSRKPHGEAEQTLWHHHDQLTLVHGNFLAEYIEQLMAAQYIKPGMTVLEIGGNIGRNSVVLASLLGPDSAKHMVTIECGEDDAQKLRDNRDVNGQQFRVCTAALSAVPLEKKGWNTRAVTKDGDNDEGWEPVATHNWQQFTEKYGDSFDTLVVDCEGCLVPILQTFPQLLDGVKTVLIENDFTWSTWMDDVFASKGLKRVFAAPCGTQTGKSVLDGDGGHVGPGEHLFYEVYVCS